VAAICLAASHSPAHDANQLECRPLGLWHWGFAHVIVAVFLEEINIFPQIPRVRLFYDTD